MLGSVAGLVVGQGSANFLGRGRGPDEPPTNLLRAGQVNFMQKLNK